MLHRNVLVFSLRQSFSSQPPIVPSPITKDLLGAVGDRWGGSWFTGSHHLLTKAGTKTISFEIGAGRQETQMEEEVFLRRHPYGAHFHFQKGLHGARRVVNPLVPHKPVQKPGLGLRLL